MDTNVLPDEIPDGFTTSDPNNTGGGPGGVGGEIDSKQAKQQAQEEQKRSILEQSLTAEALARLGTVKVS